MLVDESRDVAEAYLDQHGLNSAVRGVPEGDRVVRQVPEPATTLCPGDEVVLEVR